MIAKAMRIFQASLWLQLAVIAVLVCIAYSNSVNGEFQFDDSLSIASNPHVKGLKTVDDLNIMSGFMSGSRPLTDLSFALNYRHGRLDPRGYHIVSIFLHLLVSVVILLFLRMILEGAKNRGPLARGFLPFVVASVFAVHPVNTEAVSYLSQRAEILSALFYLAALMLYIRSFQSSRNAASLFFYFAATLFFWAALSSKLTAISLPVILVLYDYFFMSRRSFLRNLALYGPIAAGGSMVAVWFLARLGKSADIGFSIQGLNWHQYLLTQFKVVMTYIRLLFLPVNQNIDYDYPLSAGFLEPSTFLSVIAILAVLGTAVLLSKKMKIASFGILWFFITLSPTSSLVPVVDLIFEHRLYVPSVGFAIFIASMLLDAADKAVKAAVNRWMVRFGALVVVLIIISLTVATTDRNRVWQSKITLWSDAVKKSPGKARPYLSLGNALSSAGRNEEAVGILSRAVLLKDDRSAKKYEIYRELGAALHRQGRLKEALSAYYGGLQYEPDDPGLLHNVAVLFLDLNDEARAMEFVSRALEKQPFFGEALNTMGSIYMKKKDYETAAYYFMRAIASDPDLPQRYRNAAVSFGSLGRLAEAEAYMLMYLQLEGDMAKRQEALEYLKKIRGSNE